MTAVPQAQATPGQAAYEAHAAMMVPRPWRWDQLDGKMRAAWEAAAAAVMLMAQATVDYAELTSLREQLAKALAANQRWAETLGDIQQAGRERDKAREQLATTQAHRERLNRELATLTRQLNARDRQDAAIREKIAAYHDGQLSTIGAFGDIVKLIEANHD